MIRDAEQNTIGHLKYLLNKKNKIVERYKRKLIESQKYIGQEKYGTQGESFFLSRGC